VVREPQLGDVGEPMIGRKAEGLARLRELGLPVPPYVALAVGEELADVAATVTLLGEPLAVRSSAVGEDSRERSAAGQYETILGVRAGELAEAVARVRAGTERARAYGGGDEIAVVVQREVPSTRAGVAFSRDPVTGADAVVVECAFGYGDRVVSGDVTPDRYRVENGRVRTRASGDVRALRDDEVLRVADLVRRAEDGFGYPVDVEFCFEGRELWLLQCRAITTA
jgi:phosphoenolpyruvate synthase/pyruvate phosphate dikinase